MLIDQIKGKIQSLVIYLLIFSFAFSGSIIGLMVNPSSAFADSLPPVITNVSVSPVQVKSGDVLTIKAEVNDSDGVAAVSADFSYDASFNTNNRPSPTSKAMVESPVGSGHYELDYTVPASWREGTVYVAVAARDGVGNYDRDEAQAVTVKNDNTSPAVDFLNPVDGQALRTPANTLLLSANSVDALTQSEYVRFWWRAKGNAWDILKSYIVHRGNAGNSDDNYQYTLDTTGFADGFYQFAANSKDTVGNFGRDTVEVIIDNTSPIADPNGPYYVKEGKAVQLDGSQSKDSLSGIVADSYQWRVKRPNGTWRKYTGKKPTVGAFNVPGAYRVELTVKDWAGNSDTTKTAINVKNVLPDQPVLSLTRDNGIVKLKWNKVADCWGYRVVRNGEYLTGLINPKINKYKDLTVLNGQAYRYRVEAYDYDFRTEFSRSKGQEVYITPPTVQYLSSTQTTTGTVDEVADQDGEVKAADNEKKIKVEEVEEEDEVKKKAEENKTNWPMIVAIIIAAIIVLGGAAYWWYGVSEDDDEI